MEAEHVSKEPPEPGKTPHLSPGPTSCLPSTWLLQEWNLSGFVSPGSWLFFSGQAFKAGQGFMPVGQAQSVRPLSFPQLTSPWQGPTLLS